MLTRYRWSGLLLACTVLLLTVRWSAADERDKSLASLMDDVWQTELREYPTFATNAGDHRYNDRLPEMTPAAYDRRLTQQRGFLKRLKAIDSTKLSEDDRINHELLERQLRDTIGELEFGAHRAPITNRDGFHIEFPELGTRVPLDNPRDYENYIARLKGFSQYTDDHISLMRDGIKQLWVLPDIALKDYGKIIDPQIVDEPTQSRLYEPFKRFLVGVPVADRARLEAAGRAAIAESVVPGYRKFRDFLRDEYVPAARGQIGISSLPRGRDFYRHRVRRFTTLDITPEEVHAVGLAEVKRIRSEMDELIQRIKFEGDFRAFVEHLRTDPKFYPTTPEQLMKEVAFVLKRMDGELPKLFKTLPRMSYGIKPVPDFIAPQTTTAYYSPPSGDGRRAGFYYVNTCNLKSRPLYEVEVLSIHEAVPGHHLQLALQQELPNVSPLRRFSECTAFIEGWGLYSERLGKEVGFYEDPYSDFGRLSYDMWRACRLVVDTGMHYLGWTRQQSIDYMADNTALSLHNITAEVDRYISWPGQALAYKMGQLKISELRALAEKQQGEQFDIREFHEVVLGAGAVPLEVLDRRVRAWLKE